MKRLENRFFSAAVKASAFIVAAMFAFSACQPKEEVADPKVEVSQDEITSEAAGATFDVTVTSNVAWVAEIENNDKWVTVEPAEGDAGETKVTVTVKKNNGDNARDTKITFKAETATAEVSVNQFGKDNISIDKTAYEATPAGGTDAVKVTTNNNWTATVSEGASWVTVAPASGEAGEATATVTVAAYEGAEDRTATVTFAAGDAKMDYTVTQKGVSVVLSQTSWSVESAGAEAKVKVTANAAWTAASSAEWVTVEPASGEAGEVEVTVTAAKNLVEEARNATVTFTANENVKAEYAVSQAAMAPVVLKNQYAYTAAGAEVLPVDIKSKFITFSDDYICGILAPEEGITSETEEPDEYVMLYVTESAIATLLGGQTNEVDLTAVPDGDINIVLIKNSDPVVEFTEAADITSGTIKFNVSATEVVIDIEMVMPDNSKFLANTSFAPEAFVKPVGTVKITVPSKTATKADLVFTPDPLEGFTYYWDIIDKEIADILYPSDQDIIQLLVNDVNDLLAQYAGVYTWANVIDEGVVEYTKTGLEPLTEYYAVAFGVDAEGNVTTGLFKTTFTTEDLNPALKEWVGTWNVTSEQTWDKSQATPGLTDTPTERTITIGTSSVFELEVDEETDLIVAGLSYTDGMPLFNGGLQLETVGSVNEEGNLELVNGLEAFDAGEETGIFTWLGYSWSEGLSTYTIVSGNYPPFTLAFGADKTTGSAVPYAGELSNGADFTVVYYDMFIAKSTGGFASYYGTSGYGALAGKWTLTKVEETPSAAPKSAKKIVTRLEKEIKVQEAKLMQNLNSSYLFKAAQAR